MLNKNAFYDCLLKEESFYMRLIRKEDFSIYYESGFRDPDEKMMYYTGSKDLTDPKKLESYVHRIIADPTRLDFLIFSHNNELLGEAVINEIKGHRANFRIALFKEKYFNQGIGRKAIKKALAFVFENCNISCIELEVFSYNQRAKYVYETLGFKCIAIDMSEEVLPNVICDIYQMELQKEDFIFN